MALVIKIILSGLVLILTVWLLGYISPFVERNLTGNYYLDREDTATCSIANVDDRCEFSVNAAINPNFTEVRRFCTQPEACQNVEIEFVNDGADNMWTYRVTNILEPETYMIGYRYYEYSAEALSGNSGPPAMLIIVWATAILVMQLLFWGLIWKMTRKPSKK